MISNELKPLLSISQASEILGIRPQTIRKWMSEGRIEYTKIGRRSLLEQATISRLIDAGRRQAVSA